VGGVLGYELVLGLLVSLSMGLGRVALAFEFKEIVNKIDA
jgi:hypothetical protein